MKPILFNTEMVRTLLNNRKTVTRRVVKPQPKLISAQDGFGSLLQIKDKGAWFKNDPNHVAPYQSGDILYVRETWQYAYDLDGNEQPIEGTGRYLYAADGGPELSGFWVNPNGTYRDSMPWRPSIHMPREAARIFLRVTDVRAERLREINERGPLSAVSEGFTNDINLYSGTGKSATKHFAECWDSTIKPADCALYGWEANPWVWVIEFERISREEALACEQMD